MPWKRTSKNVIYHNARATFYPTAEGGLRLARVQVFAGEPRFREQGWEDVAERGEAVLADLITKPELSEREKGSAERENLLRAARRARRNAFDLIMCNPDLDAFATLTYSPDVVAEKGEYSECYPFLKNWLSNGVQRRGLKYLCVPELTKAGDVHFHAICNADALRLEAAINPHNGRPIKHHGDQVFNLVDWKAGFSTSQIIRQRADGEDARLAVSKYIFKYMGKNLGAKIGGRHVLTGGKLVRPIFAYGDGAEEFLDGSCDPAIFRREIEQEGGKIEFIEYDCLQRKTENEFTLLDC